MKGFILTLLVLIVAVLGLAWYRSWITVETAKTNAPGGETTDIKITVDRTKAREDLNEAGEKTKELVQRAQDKTENLVGTTLEGEIVKVDRGEMTVRSKDQMQTVHIAQETTIERGNQKIGPDALKVGEPVTVKFKEEQGVKTAKSIHVKPVQGS